MGVCRIFDFFGPEEPIKPHVRPSKDLVMSDRLNIAGRKRVAVIGGGIAGVGCAWALSRSRPEWTIDLFEREATLGGNAKTHDWKTRAKGVVTTGLSVLAWPRRLFHNYRALLSAIGVPSTRVSLPFMVETETKAYGKETNGVWDQMSRSSSLQMQFRDQMRRWSRMCDWAAYINDLFNCALDDGTQISMYRSNIFNFLNYITLKQLSRWFGVSERFWSEVVIPVYSSSVLSTTELGRVPAVAVPLLTAIIRLDEPSILDTWGEGHSSRTVFERMIESGQWRNQTGAAVTCVRFESDGKVTVSDTRGASRTFDVVVFACSAHDALAVMPNPSRMQSALLSRVEYCDETCSAFRHGIVHSDASVLPLPHRARLLKHYSNHIRVVQTGPKSNPVWRYIQTFIISSWWPGAKKSLLPMLVTYGAEIADRQGSSADGKVKAKGLIHLGLQVQQPQVRNRWNHPVLCHKNITIAALVAFIQGARNAFYCGSWTTPGNGHDLSLLSGLCVAERIAPGSYPFGDNIDASDDFLRLQSLMKLGRWGWRGDLCRKVLVLVAAVLSLRYLYRKAETGVVLRFASAYVLLRYLTRFL